MNFIKILFLTIRLAGSTVDRQSEVIANLQACSFLGKTSPQMYDICVGML